MQRQWFCLLSHWFELKVNRTPAQIVYFNADCNAMRIQLLCCLDSLNETKSCPKKAFWIVCYTFVANKSNKPNLLKNASASRVLTVTFRSHFVHKFSFHYKINIHYYFNVCSTKQVCVCEPIITKKVICFKFDSTFYCHHHELIEHTFEATEFTHFPMPTVGIDFCRCKSIECYRCFVTFSHDTLSNKILMHAHKCAFFCCCHCNLLIFHMAIYSKLTYIYKIALQIIFLFNFFPFQFLFADAINSCVHCFI